VCRMLPGQRRRHERARRRGQYDLIITENDLPGASGLELIRRARPPALSAHADHHVFLGSPVGRVLGAGTEEFLQNPEGIYTVREKVALLLGGQGQHA
jgi:CheY-like chemotaxis protein